MSNASLQLAQSFLFDDAYDAKWLRDALAERDIPARFPTQWKFKNSIHLVGVFLAGIQHQEHVGQHRGEPCAHNRHLFWMDLPIFN